MMHHRGENKLRFINTEFCMLLLARALYSLVFTAKSSRLPLNPYNRRTNRDIYYALFKTMDEYATSRNDDSNFKSIMYVHIIRYSPLQYILFGITFLGTFIN
jgi:hypothetical protein